MERGTVTGNTANVMSEDLSCTAFGQSGFRSISAAGRWVREHLTGDYAEGDVVQGDPGGCCEGSYLGAGPDHPVMREVRREGTTAR